MKVFCKSGILRQTISRIFDVTFSLWTVLAKITIFLIDTKYYIVNIKKGWNVFYYLGIIGLLRKFLVKKYLLNSLTSVYMLMVIPNMIAKRQYIFSTSNRSWVLFWLGNLTTALPSVTQGCSVWVRTSFRNGAARRPDWPTKFWKYS